MIKANRLHTIFAVPIVFFVIFFKNTLLVLLFALLRQFPGARRNAIALALLIEMMDRFTCGV